MQKFQRVAPVIVRTVATAADHVKPRVKPVAYRGGKPVVGPRAARELTKAEIKALPHFLAWVAAKEPKVEVSDRQVSKYRQAFPENCLVRAAGEASAGHGLPVAG
jgi:hypothetical protein